MRLAFVFKRQGVQFQKREFVPITALERDLIAFDPKEAAAAQTKRISPFENRPVSVLEKVFHLTDHLSGGELALKHGADCFSTPNGFVCDLMIDGILRIQTGYRVGVASIESLDPRFDNFFWAHAIRIDPPMLADAP
jgi:hypothetical protein